jgi:hypothetical protein
VEKQHKKMIGNFRAYFVAIFASTSKECRVESSIGIPNNRTLKEIN